MAILNYRTSITTEKTASEIQAKLVKAKAQKVLCEYSPAGVLEHIAFMIETPHGMMGYRLPANIDGVLLALQRDKKVPKSLKTREHAAKVAWRIIKDWIEAQVAIIEAQMVTLQQVFLPYMQTNNGETVYERFQKGALASLTYKPTAPKEGEQHES